MALAMGHARTSGGAASAPPASAPARRRGAAAARAAAPAPPASAPARRGAARRARRGGAACPCVGGARRGGVAATPGPAQRAWPAKTCATAALPPRERLLRALLGAASAATLSLGALDAQAAAPAASARLGALPSSYPPQQAAAQFATDEAAMPNGVDVLLMEDHEVGVVRGTLLVRGGWRAEPDSEVGLAGLAAVAQRAGGIEGGLDGGALDVVLERLAATVEASAGTNTSSVSFSCLAEDLDDVFSLFADVALRPAAPDSEVDLQRALATDSLARRKDDPTGVPGVELRRRVYGDDSPAAALTTKGSLRRSTGREVRRFLAEAFRPEGAVLGLVGDFDAAHAEALTRRYFGPDVWPRRASAPPLALREIAPIEAPRQPGVVLIDKKGLNQASIAMGEGGVAVTDADTPALSLLGELLNGFGGTLFDELRTREGLAYSVSAGFAPEAAFEGTFAAGGQTQTGRAAEFVTELQRVLKEATEAAPSQTRLADAKKAEAASFVFSQAASGSQLGSKLAFKALGLPTDLQFQLREREQALSGEGVRAAAARRLHPDTQMIVIVADADEVRASLQDAGLTIVDEVSYDDLWEDLD